MTTFKYAKVKNGIPNFALVELNVSKSENNITLLDEQYSGKGFSSQGYSVEITNNGYCSWKRGVLAGLSYAINKTNSNWSIELIKVEGLPVTDTNSAVVGLATILAFSLSINSVIDIDELTRLEEFVSLSWKLKDINSIPNFTNLSYIESIEFLNCDIYRDGGSLESVWLIGDTKHYITLKVISEETKTNIEFKNRGFTLHKENLDKCNKENKIYKDSIEYFDIKHVLD